MLFRKKYVYQSANVYLSKDQLNDLIKYIDKYNDLNKSIHEQNDNLHKSTNSKEYEENDLKCNYNELDLLLKKIESPFSEYLIELIEKSGKSDTEVYKKANIDRRLFSKIKTKKKYQPSKNTVIAIAISLELSLEDMNNFLKNAGYALSNASEKDIMIKYFFDRKIYDIDVLNAILYEKNLKTL